MSTVYNSFLKKTLLRLFYLVNKFLKTLTTVKVYNIIVINKIILKAGELCTKIYTTSG